MAVGRKNRTGGKSLDSISIVQIISYSLIQFPKIRAGETLPALSPQENHSSKFFDVGFKAVQAVPHLLKLSEHIIETASF